MIMLSCSRCLKGSTVGCIQDVCSCKLHFTPVLEFITPIVLTLRGLVLLVDGDVCSLIGRQAML